MNFIRSFLQKWQLPICLNAFLSPCWMTQFSHFIVKAYLLYKRTKTILFVVSLCRYLLTLSKKVHLYSFSKTGFPSKSIVFTSFKNGQKYSRSKKRLVLFPLENSVCVEKFPRTFSLHAEIVPWSIFCFTKQLALSGQVRWLCISMEASRNNCKLGTLFSNFPSSNKHTLF